MLVVSSWTVSVAQSTPAIPATIPTLRTNSSLVLIDVVVSATGVPVRGLESSQIRVFENGKEQRVGSFEEHVPPPNVGAATAPGSVQTAPVTTVVRMTLPPDTYSNQPAFDTTGAATVLLLDALNTPVADQMQARHQMLEYLAAVGKTNLGVRMAVFTLASRLRMVQDFTADGTVLARAVEGGPAQASLLLAGTTDQSLNSVASDMSLIDPDANATSSIQQFAADNATFQTDLRVRMTLEAMQQLARYLSAIPGRKNLIWFSGSFPLSLDPDQTLQNPFSVLQNYSDDLKLTSEMLSASRVAVYPIDARGMMGLPSSDPSHTMPAASISGLGSGIGSRRGGGRGQRSSSSRSGTSMPGTASDDQKFLNQLAAEHAAMRQIAADTGGAAFVNTNGLKEAVQQAVKDGETYYTIGYTPTNGNFDGRYRKVEVRVANAKYGLLYHHGYYATAPEAAQGLRAKLVASATVHGALASSEVKFMVRVLASGDAKLKSVRLQDGAAGEMAASLAPPLQRYVIDFMVDPRGLGLAQAADGKEHAKVEFLAIAYDANGNRLNYADKGFAFALKPEQMPRLVEQGIPERLELDLPIGKDSLRVAVHDLATDKVGSIEVPLVVGGVE